MNVCGQKLRISDISLANKKNIIQRLNAGEKNTDLAIEYGVRSSLISLIRKEKYCFLLKSAKENMSGKQKKTRAVESKLVDEKIYHWYLQKQSVNEQISATQLKEKAILLYEKFGHSNFKASHAWFSKFKQNYRISGLSNHTGRLSSDETSIRHLSQALVSHIRENGYILDNVYNGDEAGLLWRSVPQRLLTSGSKHEELGWSMKEDRVTLMVCANATGTHKLPLTVIGQNGSMYVKSESTASFIYQEQENAWMNEESFLEWYKTVFLPNVKQKKNKRSDKFLLVMDSAPPHLSARVLNEIDSSCKVFFLPVLVSALIQPINHAAQLVKRRYRKLLLQQITLSDEQKDIDGMMKYMQHLSVLDGCIMMAQAWDYMSESKLRHCWRNVLPIMNVSEQDDDGVKEGNDILCYLKQIIESFTIEETYAWLQQDSRDPGWRILSDNELLSDFLSVKMRTYSDTNIVIEGTNQNCTKLDIVKKEVMDDIFVEDIKPVINCDEICNNELENQNSDKQTSNELVRLEDVQVDLPESDCEVQQKDPLEQEPQEESQNISKKNEASDDFRDKMQIQEIKGSKRKERDSPEEEETQMSKSTKVHGSDSMEETNSSENISSSEALACVEKFYKWFEKRKEATPIDLVHLSNMIKITNNIVLDKYKV